MWISQLLVKLFWQERLFLKLYALIPVVRKGSHYFNLELLYHIIAACRHPVPVVIKYWLQKDGLEALQAVEASLDTEHCFLFRF